MDSPEETTIRLLMADNDHLRKMLDWQIEETTRMREALWEIAKTDIQTWASAALVKDDWSIVERIAEVDQQGVAHRALLGVKARAALGEKE